MIVSFRATFKLGITLATQQMVSSEFNDNIRNSISTNTSMKCAASVEGDDLRFATRDLRTTPEFIQGHATDDVNVNFACYTRNIRHKRPYTVSVKKGFIEGEPKMTPSQVQALDQSMARRYGERAPQQRPASPPSKSASEPQEDPDRLPLYGTTHQPPPKQRNASDDDPDDL